MDEGAGSRLVVDSNAVEPTGARKRLGHELVAFWRPEPWLAMDDSYTAIRSRYDMATAFPMHSRMLPSPVSR